MASCSYKFVNLSHAISGIAPLLAQALASPGGKIIGTIIAAKFLGDAKYPDALHALICADPDAALKLKKIEMDNSVVLARFLLLQNVSASNTSMAVRDHTPTVLAYLLMFGIFSMLIALLYRPIPPGNAPIILRIVSIISTTFVETMAVCCCGYCCRSNIRRAVAHLKRFYTRTKNLPVGRG